MPSLDTRAARTAGPHMDTELADQRLRGRDVGLILLGRGLGVDGSAAGWTCIGQGRVKHFAGLCGNRTMGLAAVGGARSTARRARLTPRFTLGKRSRLAFGAATSFLQEALQASDALAEKQVLAAELLAAAALAGRASCRVHAFLWGERGSIQRFRKSSRLIAEIRSMVRHQRR